MLVGGGTESFWSVGVWQLKAGEWTMVEGLTTLPASAYASLAYDVHAHQLVIASSTFLELGLSGVVTWDGVSATWGSQAADIDGLVYDPERKRLLGVGASTLERGGGRWVYRTARLAGAGHWDDRFFFDAKNHRALAFLGVGELWAFVP